MINTIGWLIICFVMGAGLYCSISFVISFLMLGLGENSIVWRLCEWSIDNKWCFPLYYLFLIALGYIGFMFQDLLNNDDNVCKR